MAAFNGTCDSKVSRASLLRGKDFKEKSSTYESQSDCSTVLEKSQEFFQTCDIEDKGFVTRRDMQRLLAELPLSSEDLENVFDSLDTDGNGFLTLEEFSSGFSEFIFGSAAGEAAAPSHAAGEGTSVQTSEMLYQSQWEERLNESEDDEERHFCMLMENLGASNVFENPAEVRSLWAQLRRDEPRLLSNFEEFLARVTYQIREANQEKREMETALKRKAASHDDEIQRLYEEMEQQIKNEKDRIILQDSERFMIRSRELEHQLLSKERELELLTNKQKRLEEQCRELHSEQKETAVENMKLKQNNEELTQDLGHTTQELGIAQEQLCLLQEQASRLQEHREMEVYRVTESLQRERASLLKQLDLLREMNKYLRDEQDMSYQKPKNSSTLSSWAERSGAIANKYTNRKQSFRNDDQDEVLPYFKRKITVGINIKDQGLVPGQEDQADHQLPSSRPYLPRIISIEEDHCPQLLQRDFHAELTDWSEKDEDLEQGIDLQMNNIYPSVSTPIPKSPPPVESGVAHTPTSPRRQPVGKETAQLDEGWRSGPDRLFKIVLVGNSSVGKTSLLRRFCDNCFYPGTSATVGIDYSVKTLTVDSSQVALQMWDTAGQERYRSITKQFFRKADAVVVMYDITNEHTFTAVRSWLANVQEGAGEDLPVMLLGNKTDLDNLREIQCREGEKLAKESKLIFFECSAFSGHNVIESMVHLARILKEQEDREKEKTVSLVDFPSKKKSCC